MRLLLRCVLALSVVVLGLTMVIGATPTVRANLEHCDLPVPFASNFGGGDGFCPAEYSTCEDEDGDGCIDIDTGGGGGGDWFPPADCGTRRGTEMVSGWSVDDYGLCSTPAQCTSRRDAYNRGLPDDGPRAYCWRSNTAPETSGQHLVVAVLRSCGGDERGSTTAGWAILDLGRCSTAEICHQRRDTLNRGVDDDAYTSRAYCWLSTTQPETAGQHLVFARRVPPPTTTPPTTTPPTTTPPTTTPPTTAPPITTPPITIRPPRDVDPEILEVS